MVRFEKNKLVIEIECQCPTGVWKDAMRDLREMLKLKEMIESDSRKTK